MYGQEKPQNQIEGTSKFAIARWTYEVSKFLDQFLERKWKELSNTVDTDEIFIDEMKTYINTDLTVRRIK